MQQVALILLRTLIGCHFLYEGYYKMMTPGWSGERGRLFESSLGPSRGSVAPNDGVRNGTVDRSRGQIWTSLSRALAHPGPCHQARVLGSDYPPGSLLSFGDSLPGNPSARQRRNLLAGEQESHRVGCDLCAPVI